MSYVPLTEARTKLSSLVDDAVSTHEIIHITKHGRPAVVLMSESDLESLQETIFWLSQPGIRDSLRESDRDLSEGRAVDSDTLRKRFGLPT
jgi:prevent-host-death family protein